MATASYTIQPNGTEINYGNGFASVAGLTLNGSATNVDDSRLQLTTGLTNQAGSVFYDTPTNIQAFTTDFAFQLSNALADGFTFTMQNVGSDRSRRIAEEAWDMDPTRTREQPAVSPRVSLSNSTSITTAAKARTQPDSMLTARPHGSCSGHDLFRRAAEQWRHDYRAHDL